MLTATRSEKERVFKRTRLAAALLRYLLEAIAVVVVLSWFYAKLPAAMDVLSELRRLKYVLLHPACAFVAGNAVIVALVCLSRNSKVENRLRRSKSEKVRKKEHFEKVLRRSQTSQVRRWRVEKDDGQFRKKIEEFIAKRKSEFNEREMFLQIAVLDDGL